MRSRFLLPGLLAFSALTACDLAPDFHPPKPDIPAAFREAPATGDTPIADGRWAASNPAMAAQFGRDEWWRVFGDDQLNALIETAYAQSPTLKAARARLQKARAFTRSEESRLWPDVTLGGNALRQKYSASNPNFPPGVPVKPFTLYSTSAAIDYGLDLFGRSRNLARAARAREAGAEETYRAARIALAADVAEAYYRLRGLRTEETVLKRNLKLRAETLTITRKRLEIGDAGPLEVARAEGEEATTRAELASVGQQRAVAEHALAILTGKPPTDFTLATTAIIAPPPAIPAGIPATLLERRPDVAQAEREMAATNAEIGYARGAFFPAITLGASFGYQAADTGSLFDWSSRTWLLGPASGTLLSLPIFTGGRNSANLAAAKAGFREAVANYRAQVLAAFQETEDALSGVRAATETTVAQEQAATAAQRAYRIARQQYGAGYIGYLERIDAERSLLTAQRSRARARADQYVASIALIRALGGGWEIHGPPAPPPAAKTTAKKQTGADVKEKAGDLPATDEPTSATQAMPTALPFAKRRPEKPVPGLTD